MPWRLSKATSFSGLSNVKAMALISKTRTYDTFLITRTTGALQTLRIPVTTPLRPVIKTVRATTWQGFVPVFTAERTAHKHTGPPTWLVGGPAKRCGVSRVGRRRSS